MNLSKLDEVTEGNTRTTGISPFMELELSKVSPNPNQPRKKFDLTEIMELAESIKQNGLMQPIVVSKLDKKYIIVSGERRYKAHLHAKIPTIKTHIIDADENKILELALVENIIREDLTDMEISLHINKLWLSGRYSDKGGLAVAIGKSAAYISKALSVIKLDDEIIKHIKETNSSIGLSVLNEIATIKEPEVQKEIYDKYRNGEITRDGIAKIKSAKKTKPKSAKKDPIKVWEIKSNFMNKDGFDIKTLNHLSIYLGGDMPKKIEKAWDETKRYKITIEEI